MGGHRQRRRPRETDPILERLRKRIRVAKGEVSADLVLKRGRVVDVFSGRVRQGDVAVVDGFIAGVGEDYRGREEVDLAGRYVLPGLIDAHLHIESTMLLPSRLAPALLRHGTTAIVSDSHEIANVMGLEGIRLLLKDSRSLPLDVFFMIPSCVPATPLETAGATLGAVDLYALRDEPRVLGLGEVMNYPGVLAGDGGLLEKILLFQDRIIDGHCPMLGGKVLQGYLASGIRSDHETVASNEAQEKLAGGMMVMIREGTSARNLRDLIGVVEERNARRFCLVSDDLHPKDILTEGHLDRILRMAVRMGMDPVLAIQLCTLNPAEYFGWRDRGAVAPGFRADLTIVADLLDFRVSHVYKDGRSIIGEVLNDLEGDQFQGQDLPMTVTFHLPLPGPEDFRIPQSGRTARIIGLIPGQIRTVAVYEETPGDGGAVRGNPETDILKLAVVERHRGSGRIGLGLVRGFGLKHGALASSVSHDSHNVIAVGVSDEDLSGAVRTVVEMGGGLTVFRDGAVLAAVPLEVAGLLSKEPIDALVDQVEELNRAAASLGCVIEEPFMTLSFLALPVVPELRLSDLGVVDVARFEVVPLFVS